MHIGIYDKPSISTNETSVPVISLLLKHGADPNLINYFNMSTFSILEMGCGPISKDLFMQLHQEWKATPRSNESEKACSNCGKDTKSNKRCTGVEDDMNVKIVISSDAFELSLAQIQLEL